LHSTLAGGKRPRGKEFVGKEIFAACHVDNAVGKAFADC
jgi:hypothetical protein